MDEESGGGRHKRAIFRYSDPSENIKCPKCDADTVVHKKWRVYPWKTADVRYRKCHACGWADPWGWVIYTRMLGGEVRIFSDGGLTEEVL